MDIFVIKGEFEKTFTSIMVGYSFSPTPPDPNPSLEMDRLEEKLQDLVEYADDHATRVGLQMCIRFFDYSEVPTRKKPGIEPILGSNS